MAEVWRFFAHEDDFADLDEVGACERLGRVLSFPTVSSMDAEAVNWQPFDDLRAYMQQAWPHVFAAGEVELIDHSLLVTLGGSDPALKPVMLMGHMDVVPVVPGTEADWTHAPFSGHVDDTYIWGRGAIDMKDQVAGILEAVEYALVHGWEHERTLLLAFGQDEETTQYGAGAIGRVLEERGVELEYLIDEGDYRIVSAAEYGAGEGWLMHADLAEKGYADIVLKTKSEGGHSSNPYGGTSLEVLSRAIAAICDIEWPTRVTDLLAAQLVELGLYTADEIAANGGVIVRDCLASNKLYPLVTTTCAPTQIEGGSTGANVMPQDMWANINFRMLEGTGVADVVDRCREAVAAAGLTGRVEVELGPGSSEPSPSPRVGGPGLEAVRTIAARYFRDPKGAEENVPNAAGGAAVGIVPSTVIGATDAANYQRICSECIRFSAFVVDDDECDRGVHGTNERITRRAYLQGVRFFIALLQTL
ncbi:M20/M25/M40 family metallo-hydrolase [Collinsella sp. HCP28S3_H5]|uniref:M20/M25/M40 family metallo-hydrolase n=1 Tax=unclassified Collinsella TaxID=2637548 RepID=UPI003F8B47A9